MRTFLILFIVVIIGSTVVVASLRPANDIFSYQPQDADRLETAPSACSTRFSTGQGVLYSRVNGTSTRLRSSSSIGSAILLAVPEGTTAVIVGGPVCNDLVWWQLNVNGTIGWTAESTSELGYLLEPVR